MGTDNPASAIRYADLEAASKHVGYEFKVVGRDDGPDVPALEGTFQALKLRSGLFLHASDAVELQDLTTHVIHQAGLTVSVFLDGSVRARQCGEDHVIGVPEGGAPRCYLFNRTEPDLFVRRSRTGTRVRKVNVTVSPEWIETAIGDLPARASLCHFIKDHGARAEWPAPARLVSLAEQVLKPGKLDPALHQLYLESRAIEILFAALSALGEEESAAPKASLRASDQRRLQRALDLFETRDAENMSLHEIAKEVGASISTLQRLFHTAYGTSIFEHIRGRRLKKARDALANDGVSVAEAAQLAGYRSAANFATAFKRAYNVSPRSLRAKT
ncbi:helix-turn-helix transcriptional regulator [Methyloligella solikamskensis]|uniref:Helix-turn-helix transcriptional regulator n=1 Tax=Methyloligella solikamskensis TaxID=1177756 RepID=A0ABW3JCT5_9HYPH